MKHTYKIYLEPEDHRKLLLKANEAGYAGRGCISHFLTKLAREPILFLDENVKTMIKAMKLK